MRRLTPWQGAEIQCLSYHPISPADRRHIIHPITQYHTLLFRCPIASQCAQVGRAGACDSMQCRALDATAECRCHFLTRWLSRLAWPGLWRAIAGHQCILLEGGRTDRLIGQTPPKTCHISRSVLFRRAAAPSSRLQQVQHCSSLGLTGGPPSHDARRWMRKGRDGSHCPCLLCHAAAPASQPPNLENAATPLPAANTLDAANSSRSSAILCPGPAAVSVGRHAAILAPHSTAMVRPSD